MIVILKTNIKAAPCATYIADKIKEVFPNVHQITIDREDCDKVLRVVGVDNESDIIDLVRSSGFECAPLQ